MSNNIETNNNSKLIEGINTALNSVLQSREEYYTQNGVPNKSEIPNIISTYSYKNATISGGSGLIPGPFGMAAAIPEIILIVRNQMAMIADIAKANGKTASNELILEILCGAAGNIATGLVAIQGQKLLVKRASLQVIQKVIQILGGKITQQVAKAMVAKWLPLAGAAAMAVWSKYSTNKIGERAKEMFSKEIIYETQAIELANSSDLDSFAKGISSLEKANANLKEFIDNKADIEKAKIQILINLMKIDGKIDEKEMEYLQKFIEGSQLSNEEQMQLIEQINSNEKLQINYSIFANDPLEATMLFIDLVTLAKIDGQVHITEKMFIKNVAKTINFNEKDLEEILENNG